MGPVVAIVGDEHMIVYINPVSWYVANRRGQQFCGSWRADRQS